MHKFLWALIFFTGLPTIIIWSFFLLSYPSQTTHQLPSQVLGASTQVATSNQFSVPEISATIDTSDGRIYILENYLRHYKSPLEPYSRLIVETSDRYTLDYRLLVAIAQQESNLCQKIPDNSYNCWGFGIYGTTVTRFDSYIQAINTVAKALKRDYIDKGLHTPEEIMTKYTPPSIEKGGPWAKGVNQFLTELE